MTTKIASLLLVSSLSVGCTASVGAVHPKPNLDLPPSQSGLRLQLSPKVLNRYSHSVTSVKRLAIGDWHTTLERGFQFSLGSKFRGNDSPYTLSIQRASPRPVVASITAEARIVEIQIDYQARLIAPNGEVLQRQSGTAVSRDRVVYGRNYPRTVSSAVEAMYEEISAKFFADELD